MFSVQGELMMMILKSFTDTFTYAAPDHLIKFKDCYSKNWDKLECTCQYTMEWSLRRAMIVMNFKLSNRFVCV